MKCKLVNKNYQNDYVNNLLLERGVENLEKFLNCDDSCLTDPRALGPVEEGRKLIEECKGKPILIVVDCDVDGFTSGAITYIYLKQYGATSIDYALHEGKQHGLQDLIDSILDLDKTYGLIILPDSSSNDYKYHEKLKELGTKVLVLDHHIIDEDTKISDNAVIINNQTSKDYPNKELTGAGVAWQFFRYVDSVNGTNYANDLIDLAALGITGDMGSVLEIENHYIIQKGFSQIKNTMFRALCEKQAYSMGGKVTPMTVAFYIVPLMNAMIRVGTMEEKVRLFMGLIDGDQLVESHKRGAKGTFERVAVESARECTNARAKQNRTLDDAIAQLEFKIEKKDLLSNRILFVRLEEEDFPSELNGLIAMKLAARYKRPTIVARLNSEGYDKGSLRGLNQSELTDFKSFLLDSNLFEFVQGHPNAAGLSIKDSNLERLHIYANEALKDIDFGETYYDVNFERTAKDSDLIFLITDITENEDIWGQHNNEPLIYIKNIRVTSSNMQIMGKKQDTLKIVQNGIAYMKFHAEDLIKELKEKGSCYLDVIGRANMNEWMGNYTPQIFITDYEIKTELYPF